MKFGVFMFPTDFSISAIELGKAVEDSGFESLFYPEHTHIPASRRTPYPGGAELPPEYSHSLDPFVALAAVAGATKTLNLGTGICLVIEHDPIVLAKEVATLDFVSGGRFLFGIGGGWNQEEMENHGTKPTLRWKILRERMLAMREIWANDNAEFHGEFVNFDPIWSWPKPVTKPHPPILMGGQGPRTFDRIVEFCDEWMPNRGRPEDLAPKIAELRDKATAAGRGYIPVSYFGCPPSASLVERYAAAGVDRVVFALPPAPSDVVLPILAQCKEAAGL